MSETTDAHRAASSDEEAILAAARHVFTERGFEAATFAELAAAAGMSQAALAKRHADKLALFTAVLVSLEQALDSHCRAASSAAFGRPMDIFMAGCRAAAEFAGRRDFARIVMIEGPAVLGEEAWLQIDHGLGLPTLANGLRYLNPSVTEAALKPMSLMIMGAMNELILALARGDEGVEIDSSLAVLESLLRTWAEPR
ncbi:MAG: TetR family transcriptional regulator [Caulobacter sp.]|nr:TetR family transcriptional regulator [Caulobacter sp.]